MGKELLRLVQTPLHLEKSWEREGVTVLTASLTLPQCVPVGRGAHRFNRFYRRYANAYLHYCETELVPRAVETMRTAMERSAPWTAAQTVLTYRVTLLDRGILSLLSDAREEGLVPRLTLRRAETWDLGCALPLPLEHFFPPDCRPRRQLIAHARAEACRQIERGDALYYPDYRVMLRRAFSSRSFYLAPDGLHWFYPMYSTAPAAEGIPDFFLPYAPQGPFLPGEDEKKEQVPANG